MQRARARERDAENGITGLDRGYKVQPMDY